MPPYRPPRPLDPVEIRILGCLVEKELSSPNTYPLSLNALLAAANQKSNRDPVLDLDEGAVEEALERLLPEVLVWRVRSSRVLRWQHNLGAKWDLDPGDKAILSELLLRGEQTPGELRARTARMHAIDELATVLDHLERLAHLDLVQELPRQPGQKETRWRHLLGATVPIPPPREASSEVAAPRSRAAGNLEARVADLETRLEEVAAELHRLRRDLGSE